jgi:orotate phosphoribosyltransferase-like protein
MSTRDESMAIAEQRRTHALTLRRQGLTLQQVGDELGVGREQARKMIKLAKRRLMKIGSPQ